MANNVIGFIGIEAHDLILYLSRILRALGREVLLVDYADKDGLATSIPVINKGDEIANIVDYHGISYTRQGLSEAFLQNYDEIIINFGFIQNEHIQSCSQLIYVVDQHKHHIEHMLHCTYHAQKKEVLLRNMVDCSIDVSYISSKLKEGLMVEDKDIHVLYYDERDIRSGLMAEYNYLVTFRNISKDMKLYLKNKIEELCPKDSNKMRKKAYRIAERGN